VAVVVNERLRRDEGKHSSVGGAPVRYGRLRVLGGHAVHVRTPLFHDVICVKPGDERDDVLLMLIEQKKTHRESREARKCPGLAIALSRYH
jgi:hypothetical protein